MKPKIKTILILMVTLLIGMVLGALIHGTVMRNRMRRTAFRMRTPEGFVQRMERMIQPDESQKAAIRAIVISHFRRMGKYREKFPGLMDSLHKELEPILTDEQNARLYRILSIRRDSTFKKSFLQGRRGPPFGRRPMPPDSARHRR